MDPVIEFVTPGSTPAIDRQGLEMRAAAYILLLCNLLIFGFIYIAMPDFKGFALLMILGNLGALVGFAAKNLTERKGKE